MNNLRENQGVRHSTLILLVSALGAGFVIQYFRSQVFHGENDVPNKTHSEYALSSNVSAVDMSSDLAIALDEITDPLGEIIYSQPQDKNGNEKDLADWGMALQGARELSERLGVLKSYVPGDLSSFSLETLNGNLRLFENEFEYLSRTYISEFDTSDFARYSSMLLHHYRRHFLELKKRGEASGDSFADLKEANLHPELIRRINSYIDVGNQESFE